MISACSSTRHLPLDIAIRDFEEKYLSGVCKVEESSFAPSDRYPRWLFKYYAERGAVFKVAVLDREVVGYAVATLENSGCHVVSIAVRPDFRGIGIGTALMCSILEDCVKRGARYAFLEVEVSNSIAIKLYEKLGFKVVSVLKNYYGSGRNAYLMKAELSR